MKEVVEKETERTETRLRDHFTLLITLSGIAITIIIGVFSISQTKNEEKFKIDAEKIKNETEKDKNESEKILNEIKNCRDKALSYTEHIQAIDKKICMPLNASESTEVDDVQQSDAENIPECATSDEQSKVDYGNTQNENAKGPSDTFDGIVTEKHECCEEKKIVGDNSIESLILKAESGDCDSQIKLSQCYRRGIDASQNDEKSRFWIEKAAKTNHPEAQYVCGLFYEKGIGGLPDFEEAIRLYTLSANQNFAPAQCKLGLLYRLGVSGVEKDLDRSVEWFEKAAASGYADAQFYLGVMLAGSRSEYPANEVKGREWYLKAAEQGHHKAQFNLALMFARGKGGKKNMPEAIKWFTLAAERGDPRAQYQLALLYQEGEYLAKDESKATALFKSAADQGHPNALEKMAKRYFAGKGTPENYAKAYAYLLAFKARTGRDSQADELLNDFKQILTPEQIAEGQAEANKLWCNIMDNVRCSTPKTV